jgi:hypothetical protein
MNTLRNLKTLELLLDVCFTKFKNNQILFRKIRQVFTVRLNNCATNSKGYLTVSKTKANRANLQRNSALLSNTKLSLKRAALKR